MDKKTEISKKQLMNSNFGKHGWSMIIVTALFYFFWAGMCTDGMNVYPGAFSGVYGMDYNTLLTYATPAGVLGVIGALVFGRLIIKWQPRKTASISLVLTGICYGLFGVAKTPVAYFICIALFTFFAQGFGLCGTTTLMSNWFPRKKGIALGWATIGAPLSSALFVPIISKLVANGIVSGFAIVGAVCAIFGIVCLFWVKDYPEHVNAFPDNIPCDIEALRRNNEEMASYKSPFTIGKLLADKDMWLISLGFGLLWLVTVGVVSQFIPRMMTVGYTQPQALTMLTIASVAAMPGSYFWGWLDQKIGTKIASAIYGISYIVALLLLILQVHVVLTWVAIIFVGLGLGGILNLMPSLVISVYGRYDFTAANSLVNTIASIVRIFAFAIMGALLTASHGDYTMPYLVFIGIDIVGIICILLVTKKCKGKLD